MEPYDRLLGDAMEGERLLFAREDEVESAWAIVDPILKRASPLHEYDPGSWGPGEANAMVSHLAGWHEPKPSTP
jgi:glucose-6-phosphate 1-dehydrogenase